jgi:hypothetical protein
VTSKRSIVSGPIPDAKEALPPKYRLRSD